MIRRREGGKDEERTRGSSASTRALRFEASNKLGGQALAVKSFTPKFLLPKKGVYFSYTLRAMMEE